MTNSSTSPKMTCDKFHSRRLTTAELTAPLTPAQVYRCAIEFCQPHLEFRDKSARSPRGPPHHPLRRRGSLLLDPRDLLPPCQRAPCEETFTARPSIVNSQCPRDQTQGQRRFRPPFAQSPAPPPQAAPHAGRRPHLASPIMANIPATTSRFTAARRTAVNCSFFAYATAYLVLHGERFTLAVVPVTRTESLKQVLQELLYLVSKRESEARVAAAGPRLLQRGSDPILAAWRGGRS